MFASLSCSLSLPSKKGYLGSPASFLLPLSSLPSPELRPLFPLRPPRGGSGGPGGSGAASPQPH